MISMIVALASNMAIGKNNQLLWHLPADFKHFKSITMGKPILMGRKTFESIGKPLPGRKNIVVTRDDSFSADGVIIVDSIDAALEASKVNLSLIGSFPMPVQTYRILSVTVFLRPFRSP